MTLYSVLGFQMAWAGVGELSYNIRGLEVKNKQLYMYLSSCYHIKC